MSTLLNDTNISKIISFLQKLPSSTVESSLSKFISPKTSEKSLEPQMFGQLTLQIQAFLAWIEQDALVSTARHIEQYTSKGPSFWRRGEETLNPELCKAILTDYIYKLQDYALIFEQATKSQKSLKQELRSTQKLLAKWKEISSKTDAELEAALEKEHLRTKAQLLNKYRRIKMQLQSDCLDHVLAILENLQKVDVDLSAYVGISLLERLKNTPYHPINNPFFSRDLA
jgi:hypothetical protein